MIDSRDHPQDTSHPNGAMSRRERDDLARLTRQRERLAKATAETRAAEVLADFEAQMAALYSFDDDEVWREAVTAADEAVKVAQSTVDLRCAELGIPKAFRPRLSGVAWYGRGSNAVASRRVELRKVAQTGVAAMAKDAKRHIEAASLEVQTRLLADGLTSEAALAFLASMPAAEDLMAPLAMSDVREAAIPARRGREGW